MLDSRDAYIEFVERTYFGNVTRGRIDEVMACFGPDAKVVIRHGDNPERRFTVAGTAGETALSGFYGHLCRNYETWFGNFRHFIDVIEARAACHFEVRLRPRADGLYADAGVQALRNCNFFEFREDLICRMTIYYANPQPGGPAGRPADAPTGYPQS